MDAKAKAQAIFDAVKAGRTVFTRATDQWMIVGPTDQIKPDQTVAVTKANGDQSIVMVTEITGTHERQGVRYSVARFTRDPEPHPATRDGYRTVNSPVYGPGRVYHAQPGATQYDDGTGRYNTQIWDNS